MKVAVIGGTGVYDPTWLQGAQEQTVDTPYGATRVTVGALDGGQSVVFMNRHGLGHSVPPHQVNYRANLWALKSLGVDRVIATAAVGSLNLGMPPGSMVLVDQFLDFTKSRPVTFHDGGEGGVVHTDVTEPYCPASRDRIWQAARDQSLPLVMGGVYVTTEGPRFETPAEIRAFRILGGDLVGMTGVPEVVLARELGLCYTTIALVTNFAAGISKTALTHQEVLEVMAQHVDRLRSVMGAALKTLAEDYPCSCPPAEGPLKVLG
ncbi:MAG: S-methyl-5'-thioadenosine phosphorylase [Firmicutes bacterium]|nr:S-methyl-5'-thioadenosine phosphorylase [Bacillota bacterium]